MNTRGQGLDANTQTHKVGKNYLFSIAIDRYQYSPPLYNCVRDAEHIIGLLHQEYQFTPENTFSLYNEAATEKNIFDTFKKLVTLVRPEDNLLILYSGHGEFEADIEEGYWIPVDAQLGDFSDYVSNSRIVKYLKAIDAHHILLIVDSCFSGTLFANRNLGSAHSASRLDEIPSRWLITAGRNEVVSDGKPGDHSPFADNILYFLENNKDQSLSVADLSDAVIDAVIYNSRQTPRGEPLQDVGHRGGQFFFHRKGFVPTTVAKTTSSNKDPEPIATAKVNPTGATKGSGGSGFWIFGAIAVGVVLIVYLAGRFFSPELEAPAELEYDAQIDLPETSPTDKEASPSQADLSTKESNTEEDSPTNRVEQAWAAAQKTNTEEAYRRFIDRFPKSRLVNEAEVKIAEKYRYAMDFSPTLRGGQQVEINFGVGQAPFRIQIIKPNGEVVVKHWDKKATFKIDLGEIEKKKSGVNVLKVIVSDHNFKKAGHVLPIY